MTAYAGEARLIEPDLARRDLGRYDGHEDLPYDLRR
jgi:hypothetical protein